MNKKIIVWMIVLLCFLPLVLSLGVRPAKTTLFFEEGRDYTQQIWVVNNDHREFSVKVSAEGEMGRYATLDVQELSFRTEDEAKPINIEIHLPEDVPPGTSTANIIIEEEVVPLDGNVISSKIMLKHKILIEGPYPDKYIEAKLNFQEAGREIRFVSEVTNKGKKEIGRLRTTFYVNDKEQQPQILETEQTSLKTNENKLLSTAMPRSAFEAGEFEVSAVTAYDDLQVEVTKELIVGKPEIDIAYFDAYFIANKINPYSLDLLNKWNKEIKNIYVDVEVKKNDQKIDQFRTKSVDIESGALKRINDYLDARNKGQGKYTFEMIVNFWNTYRMESRTFQAEFLSEDDFKNIERSPLPLTGNSISETTPTKPRSWLKIIGMAVLILIVGMGFYWGWRYAHRKEYEGGENGPV